MSTVRVPRGKMRTHTRLIYRPTVDEETETTPERAVDVAFETCHPMRTFTYAKDQKHTPGLFWSATTLAHIPYESRLERAWLLEADYDRSVVAIAAQPFLIEAIGAHGSWTHTPDIFLRYADGTAHVRDVKDPRETSEADVLLQTERTARLCDEIGWSYDVVTEPDRQRTMNLEWLCAYRRVVRLDVDLSEQILFLARQPITVSELTHATGRPEETLPLLFHLAWRQQVRFDLHRPLSSTTHFHT